MIPKALRVSRPLAGILALGFALSACEYIKRLNPAEPSSETAPPAAGGAGSYLGTWSSVVAGAQATSTKACSRFEWIVTSQTGDAIAGTFKATCLEAFTITGNAEGRLATQTSVEMAVSGSARVAGITCVFSLSGTGNYEGDSIRVPYSGSTCLGPVSGTETLRRSAVPGLPGPAPPAAPAPPPSPEPPPAPAPVPSSRVPCALGDGPRIVECVQQTFADYTRPVGSLSERQANMSFLRDRIIEAGKCSGLDFGWNLKRGGPDLSIDFLAWRQPGGEMGVDIAADYDNTGNSLRLQWYEAGFGATFKPYPNPTCG